MGLQKGFSMNAFNQEHAIAQYASLMSLIRAGAYQERDIDGSYGADGIEKAVDELTYQAARHGLTFIWHEDTQTHTLELMSSEESITFFIAQLPSGIERDVRGNYQAHGDVLPSMAIRHWIEITGTHGGSLSQWTCDGYASSRQYAGMLAEQLHKAFGHAYEVWSLRPFGNSPGPHIIDFVPTLATDPAKYQGELKQVTEYDIRRFSEQWVIAHYGIHESNHQYVKALAVTFPKQNQVYTCRVQFSQSGEQVELHMHHLPGGLSVFSLRYSWAESKE
jgi:hypothetical protein